MQKNEQERRLNIATLSNTFFSASYRAAMGAEEYNLNRAYGPAAILLNTSEKELRDWNLREISKKLDALLVPDANVLTPK